MRKNLDPFNEHSTEALQDALCAVVECDNADAQKFYGSLGYAALPENRGRLYYTKDLA